MTLTAEAKVHLQVIPGHGSEKKSRRSTIAACDAPPPYSNNAYVSHQQDATPTMDASESANSRRRNRSAGSTPSSTMASPNGVPRRIPSSVSAVASPTMQQQQPPIPRRRIPSDPSALPMYRGVDIRSPPQVMRF